MKATSLKKFVVAIPILSAALAQGCASRYRAVAQQQPSNDPYLMAHTALARGDTRAARVILGRPPGSPEESGAIDNVHVLLLGETALCDDDPETAGRMAAIVLARNENDPRGLELAGKAALRLGDFRGAEQFFNSAADKSRAPEHRQRLTDFGNLAGGLGAYACGDMTLARKRLSEVRDPSLRLEITRTYGAVVSAEAD